MVRTRLPVLLTVPLMLLLIAACAPRAVSGSTGGRLPDLLAPEVSLPEQGATIVSFDPPGAGAQVNLKVTVAITNPNPFPLHLRNIDHSVDLGQGTGPITGSNSGATLSLLPGASSTVEILVNTSIDGDALLLQSVASAYRGVPLVFSAGLQVSYSSPHHSWLTVLDTIMSGSATPAGPLQQPIIELTGRVSSVHGVVTDTALLQLQLDVFNPGSVGYLLHGKDLSLELEGLQMAVLDLPPTPVPANATVPVTLAFEAVTSALDEASRSVLSDALAGQPTALVIRGGLALDVLGLDTFELPSGLYLTSLIQRY